MFTSFSIFSRQACKKKVSTRQNQLILICLDVFFNIDGRKVLKNFKNASAKHFCRVLGSEEKFRHWKTCESLQKKVVIRLIYVKGQQLFVELFYYSHWVFHKKSINILKLKLNEEQEYEWKDSSQHSQRQFYCLRIHGSTLLNMLIVCQ